MNPVREAIFDVLDADVQLAALATGGIHYRAAPDESLSPFVIYHKSGGNRMWTFAGAPMHGQTWIVKGVSDDAGTAEDMNARCVAVLSDAVLSVDGHTVLLAPMPDVDIDFADDTDGEHTEHVGTQYKLVVEETS